MSALDTLIPTPRLLEVDEVDLALPLKHAWDVVRHADLGGGSRLIRALFAVRTLPARLISHRDEPLTLRLDDLVSTPQRPGFQVLADEPPVEVAVGAVGKVWHAEIPFVHVPTAAAFASFSEEGYVKVAWGLRLSSLGEHATRVAFELRVDATDEESWRKFRAYFRLIGPGSHFIRRSLLAGLVRDHGTPESRANERPLTGDELLGDGVEQVTHAVTIAEKPEAIWPWLVQMGCRRAGFYSWDALDNGGRRSAREIHPELQSIRVGEILPATPDGEDGFEVLRVEAPRALVLGGLYDVALEKQLPFGAVRPSSYWQVTWSFVLDPIDERHTRLLVRARAACPPEHGIHLAWMRFVHHFMETAQLRHLAARVEGRLPLNDYGDMLEGVAGAGVMVVALLTPFLRERRSHWGLSAADARRTYPGDELVPHPAWSWTHGVDVEARPDDVWPWLSQIGATKAGFYSYQWLEDIAGCEIQNAEVVHPEWEVREGDEVSLHPRIPGPKVVSLERGRYFVVFAPADSAARAAGRPWATMSWLFFVEALGPSRCRVISRYRADCSDDLSTRLAFGSTFIEPIGFAMDRRMLLGVKQRAEQR